jgi:hypothetical protein
MWGNDKIWGYHEVIKCLKSLSILIYECMHKARISFFSWWLLLSCRNLIEGNCKVLSHQPWNWMLWNTFIWRKRSLFIIVCDPECLQSLHFLSKEQLIWKSLWDPHITDESNVLSRIRLQRTWELIFYVAMTNLLFISSTGISTKYIKTRVVWMCMCVYTALFCWDLP